jgi:hypothetical protein
VDTYKEKSRRRLVKLYLCRNRSSKLKAGFLFRVDFFVRANERCVVCADRCNCEKLVAGNPDDPSLRNRFNKMVKEGHCTLIGNAIAVDCQASKMLHLDTKMCSNTEAVTVPPS